MRTPNIGSILYSPNDAPADPAQLQRFLREELARIAGAIAALAVGHLDVSYSEPEKRGRGDIRYADGVQWNPGSGEGVYLYNGAGVWKFLG